MTTPPATIESSSSMGSPVSCISSILDSDSTSLHCSSPGSEHSFMENPKSTSRAPSGSPSRDRPSIFNPCIVCKSDRTKRNYARHMRRHRPLVFSEDCVCEGCKRRFGEPRSCDRHIEKGRCGNIAPDAIAEVLARRKAAAEARKPMKSKARGRKPRARGRITSQAKSKTPEPEGANASPSSNAAAAAATPISMDSISSDLCSPDTPASDVSFLYSVFTSLENFGTTSPESDSDVSEQEGSADSEMSHYFNFDFFGEEVSPLVLTAPTEEQQLTLYFDGSMNLAVEQWEDILARISYETAPAT